MSDEISPAVRASAIREAVERMTDGQARTLIAECRARFIADANAPAPEWVLTSLDDFRATLLGALTRREETAT